MDRLERIFKQLLFVFLVGALVVVTSCSSDDDSEPEPTENLYALISADANLSQLLAWIDSDADLKGFLEGTTTYTLFAPNNAAFDKLAETLGVESLEPSTTTVAAHIIKATLLFHLTAGDIESSQLANGSFTSLQGEDIAGNADGTIATGGSDDMVEVLSADNRATNGRYHVVETVLIPPTLFATIGLNLGKLSQAILLGADFTTLAEAIAKADEFAAGAQLTTISARMAGTDLYTMFAPTNATFLAGSITADTYDGQTWYGIISNHFVPAATTDDLITQTDMTTCATYNTTFTLDGQTFGELEFFFNTDVVAAANGIGVYIDSNGDVDCTLADQGASLTNLDAEVALPNAFEASNGLLHVIAGVLAPQ